MRFSKQRQIDTRELISDFIRATEGCAPETAARIAGICEATYLRWTHRQPRQLRVGTRDRLERFLAGSV